MGKWLLRYTTEPARAAATDPNWKETFCLPSSWLLTSTKKDVRARAARDGMIPLIKPGLISDLDIYIKVRK
jgi:hypothetical protein